MKTQIVQLYGFLTASAANAVQGLTKSSGNNILPFSKFYQFIHILRYRQVQTSPRKGKERMGKDGKGKGRIEWKVEGK